MKTAARDGNGYPFIEPQSGEKVALVWRAEPLPRPEGGGVVPPPEPTPPASPPPILAPLVVVDDCIERGGWARTPTKPVFLPGFEPPDRGGEE